MPETRCPVCGDLLAGIVNVWVPERGYESHEGVHVGDASRVARGLVARRCSWAEPFVRKDEMKGTGKGKGGKRGC